jgi:hypothetical protein
MGGHRYDLWVSSGRCLLPEQMIQDRRNKQEAAEPRMPICHHFHFIPFFRSKSLSPVHTPVEGILGLPLEESRVKQCVSILKQLHLSLFSWLSSFRGIVELTFFLSRRNSSLLTFFFFRTGIGTQDFTFAKQAHYHFSQGSIPFCSHYFGNRGLLNYLPGLTLISASQVTRITSMSHRCPASLSFWSCWICRNPATINYSFCIINISF